MGIDIFDNFYRGKRVLVTGHTGFKGSWLSIWLHELGAEVIGVAQDPFTVRDNFVLSGIGEKIKADLRADIRDGERIKAIFQEYQPAAEIAIASWRRSFFHPEQYDKHGKSIASVRAGNVIGGGDWALDRIIPDCIKALESGAAIDIRSPKAIRPWQHVLEPLSGYLLLASCLLKAQAVGRGNWNFGPNAENVLGHSACDATAGAPWLPG